MDGTRIPRTLTDGWHFRPDWRAAVVEQMLKPPRTTDHEPDPFVRQYLRFRATGECVDTKAFSFAHECHRNRGTNVASGIIRAMSIAGFTAMEIGKQLGTSPKNIAAYQRLFFDVIRYLDQRAWLASIITPLVPLNPHDPIVVRTQLLLSAALNRGASGVLQLITNSVPQNAEELQQLTEQIRGALTMRAHAFVMQQLNAGVGGDDLVRYIDFSRLPAAQDVSAEQVKWRAFYAGLIDVMHRKQNEEIEGRRRQSLEQFAQLPDSAGDLPQPVEEDP